jgi:exonuclease VII small subunit
MSYTKDKQRLDHLVGSIEQCGVDELEGIVQEAGELLKRCRARIAETETRVRETIKDLGDDKARS